MYNSLVFIVWSCTKSINTSIFFLFSEIILFFCLKLHMNFLFCIHTFLFFLIKYSFPQLRLKKLLKNNILIFLIPFYWRHHFYSFINQEPFSLNFDIFNIPFSFIFLHIYVLFFISNYGFLATIFLFIIFLNYCLLSILVYINAENKIIFRLMGSYFLPCF